MEWDERLQRSIRHYCLFKGPNGTEKLEKHILEKEISLEGARISCTSFLPR